MYGGNFIQTLFFSRKDNINERLFAIYSYTLIFDKKIIVNTIATLEEEVAALLGAESFTSN